MANIALVKLFSGLYLGTAQLSGELHRAGHESHIFHFKQFESVNINDIEGNFELCELYGTAVGMDGSELVWPCYKPFFEEEIQILIQEIENFKPDGIGMSAYSGILAEAIYVSNRLKEHFKDIPIIWGGPGPTLEPDRCIEHADIICINEGEEVIVEFADNINNPEALRNIEGTWAKDENGEIIKNPKRPWLDLNQVAIPDWRRKSHTFIHGTEVHHNAAGRCISGEYLIMTQRGCPFSCSFCIESTYQNMFGKKNSLRRRSPELVIEELKQAKEKFKLRSVYFWDDVFTVNPRWLDEFLPRYKEEIRLPFWCYTYPTTHNPVMLAKLYDAGCRTITMGVQSGSERLLKEVYNRPTKRERVIQAAQEIVDSGIIGSFDLITQSDFETEEDLQETFEFLMEFPQQIVSQGFASMISYPNYPYTEMERGSVEQIQSTRPSKKVYDYYHHLFRLTRTTMSKDEMRAIANDPQYREDPQKLVDLLIAYEETKGNWLNAIADGKAAMQEAFEMQHPEKVAGASD